MDNPIDGIDGKLGHGFTSADELEEIDIGPGDRPRPMYVSAKLNPKYKQELIDLLKEFKDCFAWEYCNTPGVWLPHLHWHFINMSIIHPFMSLDC